ncbi:MAG: hypothetical protein A4E35_00378 [Methanoregula sp. PtaU1.Bin051]|nr:MAG: hypothetical protein A4E35_00378 [Methanoregula sp. PtaU1.Bin051]
MTNMIDDLRDRILARIAVAKERIVEGADAGQELAAAQQEIARWCDQVSGDVRAMAESMW